MDTHDPATLLARIQADMATLRLLDPISAEVARCDLDPEAPVWFVSWVDEAGTSPEVQEGTIDEIRALMAEVGAPDWAWTEGEPGMSSPHLIHPGGAWISLDPAEVARFM